MTSVPGSRAVSVALVVLLLGTTLAGSGVAAANADGSTAPPTASAPVATPPTVPSLSAGTWQSVGRRPRPGDPPSSSAATVTDRGGTASVTGTATAVANASRRLVATQTLRLTPADPGTVAVTVAYDTPETLTELETAVPENATVTDTAGFALNGTRYEWDGETATPSVTYATDVNESRDVFGPEGGEGQYLFVDAGEWAFFRRPAIRTSWGWRGPEPVGLDRETSLAGPGYVGEWMVYMGERRVVERQAHGQRFELVVPERSTLAESPDAVLDSLTRASDQLRVGDRDERVVAFAVPTTSVTWAARGLQFGETDMWVRDAEPLDTVENTWIHEYVHTRTDFEPTTGTQWTVEALATYYAALLTVEQDLAPLSTFGPYLGQGGFPPHGSAVLSAPRTWVSGANYWKGGLVVGDLDRRIRVATDSELSFQTVFSGMNAHRGPLSGPDVERLVGAAGGPAVRDSFVAYATTRQSPQIWSRETHERVFDATPARVSVGFSERADALTVSGPFRNSSLAPRRAERAHVGSPQVTLFTGETLAVRANVTNAGGATTRYDAPFAVGDDVVANATGSVAPGETVIASFERTFSGPGEHVVAVGSDEVTVEVYDPAPVRVASLDANRTDLAAPGAVALTLTVANNYSVPARGHVALARGDTEVLNRTVSLGAGARRVLATTVRLDGTGLYGFTAGGVSVDVTVGDVTDAEDGSDGDGSDGSDGSGGDGGGSGDGTDGGEGSGDSGAGFGVGAALVAVLASAVWGAVRRRRDRGRDRNDRG